MNSLGFSAGEVQINIAYVEYKHKNKYCTSTAYELGESAELLLKIPRALGASAAHMLVYNESCSSHIYECSGVWQEIDEGYDVYSFKPEIKKIGVGLYFMRPDITVFGERLYGHKNGQTVSFDTDSTLYGLLQLTVCDFIYAEPTRMYGGTIYHIFVDRFRRGGERELPDSAILATGEWDRIPEYPEYQGAPLKNNTFYGGTLWGIIEKLDYIKSLGTTAIYLSPIFESVSNHKYDTANYMRVDPIFGGDAALERLIEEARKRDIVIILDGVFNHTGDDSIYFNRHGRYGSLGAYQSKDSPYYSWYDFKKYPDEYTAWWDIDILPRINPDNPTCNEYFVGDKGVIGKYRDAGIYGFRLDVADELSDKFISQIKARLSSDGESVLYGEVWEDASNKIAYETRKRYFLGRELDGVMNYPVRRGLIDFIMGVGAESLMYALTEITDNAPDRILHSQMNLLGTHDTERILTLLGGESSEGKTNRELSELKMSAGERTSAIKKLKALYTVLATLPGVPAIFYGDEVGLEGYHDPFNRMPYPWGRECGEILAHYRRLGEIRQKYGVYKKGAFKLLCLTESLLVFARIKNKTTSYVTVLNNSDSDISLSFDTSVLSLLSLEKKKLHSIPPYTSAIFESKSSTTFEIA